MSRSYNFCPSLRCETAGRLQLRLQQWSETRPFNAETTCFSKLRRKYSWLDRASVIRLITQATHNYFNHMHTIMICSFLVYYRFYRAKFENITTKVLNRSLKCKQRWQLFLFLCKNRNSSTWNKNVNLQLHM